MAGVADLIPWLFEKKFGNDAVPQMAFLALFLLDGGMYVFHPEVGVSELGVTIETLLADKGSPFGRRSAGSKVNNHAQEKQYSCSKVYTASSRWRHCGAR